MTPSIKEKASGNYVLPISALLLVFLMCTASLAKAQAIINAAGGHKTISGNYYAYSIGEMTLVNTASSASLIVTQGLLQPNAQGDGINETLLPANDLTVYPNPFNAIINLNLKLPQGDGALTVKIFDALGRLVQTKKWQIASGNETFSLNLNSLAAGTYLLRAQINQSHNQAHRDFKIQKLK